MNEIDKIASCTHPRSQVLNTIAGVVYRKDSHTLYCPDCGATHYAETWRPKLVSDAIIAANRERAQAQARMKFKCFGCGQPTSMGAHGMENNVICVDCTDTERCSTITYPKAPDAMLLEALDNTPEPWKIHVTRELRRRGLR
jgi:hypothetical protein